MAPVEPLMPDARPSIERLGHDGAEWLRAEAALLRHDLKASTQRWLGAVVLCLLAHALLLVGLLQASHVAIISLTRVTEAPLVRRQRSHWESLRWQRSLRLLRIYLIRSGSLPGRLLAGYRQPGPSSPSARYEGRRATPTRGRSTSAGIRRWRPRRSASARPIGTSGWSDRNSCREDLCSAAASGSVPAQSGHADVDIVYARARDFFHSLERKTEVGNPKAPTAWPTHLSIQTGVVTWQVQIRKPGRQRPSSGMESLCAQRRVQRLTQVVRRHGVRPPRMRAAPMAAGTRVRRRRVSCPAARRPLETPITGRKLPVMAFHGRRWTQATAACRELGPCWSRTRWCLRSSGWELASRCRP